jgi:hypothetical protein
MAQHRKYQGTTTSPRGPPGSDSPPETVIVPPVRGINRSSRGRAVNLEGARRRIVMPQAAMGQSFGLERHLTSRLRGEMRRFTAKARRAQRMKFVDYHPRGAADRGSDHGPGGITRRRVAQPSGRVQIALCSPANQYASPGPEPLRAKQARRIVSYRNRAGVLCFRRTVPTVPPPHRLVLFVSSCLFGEIQHAIEISDGHPRGRRRCRMAGPEVCTRKQNVNRSCHGGWRGCNSRKPRKLSGGEAAAPLFMWRQSVVYIGTFYRQACRPT